MFMYGRKPPEQPTPLRPDNRKHVDPKRSKINTGVTLEAILRPGWKT